MAQTQEWAELPTDEPPARDATAAMPAVGDATAAIPVTGDETAPLPRDADGTVQLPAAAATANWSARAEVPPVAVETYAPVQWEEPPPPTPGGRWWLPILIGVVVLLLLGILGYGLWLIASAADETPVTSAPTSAAPAAPPPTSAAPPPTSAAPPTQPAQPVRVVVPPVAGETAADARARLDEAGLPYRLRYRTTDEEPAGTVIRTDPPGGTAVSPDTEITLFIARAPEPPAPPTSDVPASPLASPLAD